ncbi:MAG: type II toxin-antitoxin system HicA family toxin [Bacteroidota bacterium]
MNTKQRKTLTAIFQEPVRPNVRWKDIETLLEILGAEISPGNGSRVRAAALKGVRAVFHRPHPQKITDKGALKSVRRFLITAGVKQ